MTRQTRKEPRYTVQTAATLEVPREKGRTLVKADVRDLSRGGICVRAPGPVLRASEGNEIVIRFRLDGHTFSLPGRLVWARAIDAGEACAGVRLDLRRAAVAARRIFDGWMREVELARESEGAPPPREQLECRLAALTGSLDDLLMRLANDAEPLEARALAEIDQAAEHLQNAITGLELTRQSSRAR